MTSAVIAMYTVCPISGTTSAIVPSRSQAGASKRGLRFTIGVTMPRRTSRTQAETQEPSTVTIISRALLT